EIKLSNTLYHEGVNAADLHLATAEELVEEGIVAGYTSPLHKDEHVLIVADPSLKLGNNFVAGANRVDYHVKNVNYPRDFRVDVWEDIASAYDGNSCGAESRRERYHLAFQYCSLSCCIGRIGFGAGRESPCC